MGSLFPVGNKYDRDEENKKRLRKRKWYTFKSVFALSDATICNENKGEKSKEPMGTNTQEGPTVQESAGD